jgi:hypothetical protein
MRQGQSIKKVTLIKGINHIELDRIYPISPIKDPHIIEIEYLIDSEVMMHNSTYANKLNITTDADMTLDILCGAGYVAEKDDVWTNQFVKWNEWSGGDGIYSFNLTDGNDAFDQLKNKKTLFVFGDTFVGTSDPVTDKRYQPHLMPNNSLGIHQNGKTEFKVNWQPDGSVSGFYKMDPAFDYAGTVPENIIYYDRKEKNMGYLSGLNPKVLELNIDLYTSRHISRIDFYNYYSEESSHLAKRGFKSIEISSSDDGKIYKKIKNHTLRMAKHLGDLESVELFSNARYIKIHVEPGHGIGNHNDESFTEGMYGLNLIKLYSHDQQLRDLKISSTSVLLKDPEHSWIWLQDGAIINSNLYFLPMVINSDLNQPEGLQFCVKGVAIFKTPIKDEMIDYKNSVQKAAPLLVEDGTSQWLFGGGIMANTKTAGAKNPDGYVYIYGYKTTLGMRELVVARVLEEKFELFDDWRFFNGETWVTNIFESKPLLEHISCEFSVSQVLEGLNKNKYICVFTYDTNTPYVSFSIGDSPVGPFTRPQKLYHTPEQEKFKSTTYTYNAKAHPHLSESTSILVTYNTNTYNFQHNMDNHLIYRPRFLRFNDTTKK